MIERLLVNLSIVSSVAGEQEVDEVRGQMFAVPPPIGRDPVGAFLSARPAAE